MSGRVMVSGPRRGLGTLGTIRGGRKGRTGGPSPTHPQQCAQTDQFRPCEGWSPGSSTNPTQTPGDLSPQTKAIAFPRDVGLKATVRPLDDCESHAVSFFCSRLLAR